MILGQVQRKQPDILLIAKELGTNSFQETGRSQSQTRRLQPWAKRWLLWEAGQAFMYTSGLSPLRVMTQVFEQSRAKSLPSDQNVLVLGGFRQ